jgi:hypothetical protein
MIKFPAIGNFAIYKNGQIIAILQNAIYKTGQIIAILQMIKIPFIGNFSKFIKTDKFLQFGNSNL